MISMGQKLYELWRDAMSQQGMGVDEWADLSRKEQDAWERLGDQVTIND